MSESIASAMPSVTPTSLSRLSAHFHERPPGAPATRPPRRRPDFASLNGATTKEPRLGAGLLATWISAWRSGFGYDPP
jgi:hypothetical protein